MQPPTSFLVSANCILDFLFHRVEGSASAGCGWYEMKCTLLLLLSAVSLAVARPAASPSSDRNASSLVLRSDVWTTTFELQKRAAGYAPPILFPTAGTVFLAGDQAYVLWNATLPNGIQPSRVPPTAKLVLGYFADDEMADPGEHLNISFPLAASIQLYNGSTRFNFTLPTELTTRTTYILGLLGSSGNVSPRFTIIGNGPLPLNNTSTSTTLVTTFYTTSSSSPTTTVPSNIAPTFTPYLTTIFNSLIAATSSSSSSRSSSATTSTTTIPQTTAAVAVSVETSIVLRTAETATATVNISPSSTPLAAAAAAKGSNANRMERGAALSYAIVTAMIIGAVEWL